MIIISYLALIRLLFVELGFRQVKRKYMQYNTIQYNTIQYNNKLKIHQRHQQLLTIEICKSKNKVNPKFHVENI